jgi:hypothetical protein
VYQSCPDSLDAPGAATDPPKPPSALALMFPDVRALSKFLLLDFGIERGREGQPGDNHSTGHLV